ncbi:MAG: hypothetical protein GY906_16030 [bacterium]|nr:hypothetical protein [bacterium]
MKIAVTLILLSGFTTLPLASTQVPSDEHGNGMVEPAKQSDDAILVFSSLELDQTNVAASISMATIGIFP